VGGGDGRGRGLAGRLGQTGRLTPSVRNFRTIGGLEVKIEVKNGALVVKYALLTTSKKRSFF
jgi:hypothetical protein